MPDDVEVPCRLCIECRDLREALWFAECTEPEHKHIVERLIFDHLSKEHPSQLLEYWLKSGPKRLMA